MAVNDEHYSSTADYSESTFQDSLIDINNKDDNYVTVDGPYGFGLATGLRSAEGQCMKTTSLDHPSGECLSDPTICEDGLSFSIWERVVGESTNLAFSSTSDTLEEPDPDNFGYIVSTGGDSNGHPGISLAHDGPWLIGVVSGGSEYWRVAVYGHTLPESWNNIGLAWNVTGGLTMYINLTAVGHTKYPTTAATTQPPLDPTELMIGCHKTSEDSNYRGFNNADVDEFAVWERMLEPPDVNMFRGGYKDENIGPDEAATFIDSVDMSDPDQQKSVVGMLNKMTAETTSDSASQSTSDGSSTAKSPTATTGSSTGLKNKFKIMYAILDPSKLPPTLDIETMEDFLKSMDPLDNLLKPSKGSQWCALQSETDEAGAMQLVSRFADYTKQILLNTDYPNGTEPFCNTTILTNILNHRCMMKVSDFREKGMMVVIPTYTKDMKLEKNWKNVYDRIAFPTGAYPDKLCAEQTLSYTATLHHSVSKFGHTDVNQVAIPRGPKHELDSRILSVAINVHPQEEEEEEEEETSSETLFNVNEIRNCKLDQQYLKKKPIRIKLEHKSKIPAANKTEKNSDIAVRRCVWWNKDLSDFGVWDSTGCLVKETTAQYTICVCDKLGTYAILAEKIPEKIIPEEPFWLTVMKYVFYGISGVALTLYIVTVAVSEDLKDQFHMMGLNLSVGLLAGSAVMILSDFEMMREDETANIAVGTLIHFFYGAVGFWMLTLGQASFSAITGGIIGGRLQAYMFLSWGGALAMTGVPFVYYLHDLGTDPRCFISWSDEVKMVFFCPQTFCAGAAMLCGVVVLCNLSTPALRKENLVDDYGSFCRGAGLLLIFLSLNWIFGLLTYIRFGFTEPDFYPIFQVLNSLAGVFLFVFIGIGSNRFRMFVIGQAKIRRKMVKAHAFGLPGANEPTNTDVPKVWHNN